MSSSIRLLVAAGLSGILCGSCVPRTELPDGTYPCNSNAVLPRCLFASIQVSHVGDDYTFVPQPYADALRHPPLYRTGLALRYTTPCTIRARLAACEATFCDARVLPQQTCSAETVDAATGSSARVTVSVRGSLAGTASFFSWSNEAVPRHVIAVFQTDPVPDVFFEPARDIYGPPL